MQTEIEVKFLNVNFDEIRTKLKGLGAELEQPMRLMRRAIIDYPDMRLKKRDGYIRVRDEGHRVTITYKQHDSLGLGGAKEIEVEVSSFNKIVAIWQAAGLEVLSLQESKRENWRLGNVEIVLDEWPWLKTYIEIEGNSEASVKEVAESLGFNWSKQAVFGDVMVAYRAQYPWLKKGDSRNVGRIKNVRFGDPFPDLMKQRQATR